MYKSELIQAVAEETGVTQKEVDRILKNVVKVITEELKSGGIVQLTGFGTFRLRYREERIGRNPRTGETVNIPAATVPIFKSGKQFKDRFLQK